MSNNKTFSCVHCKYSIDNKHSFNTHLKSTKHINNEKKVTIVNQPKNQENQNQLHQLIMTFEKRIALLKQQHAEELEEQETELNKLREENGEYIKIIRQFIRNKSLIEQQTVKYISNNHHSLESFDDFIKQTLPDNT